MNAYRLKDYLASRAIGLIILVAAVRLGCLRKKSLNEESVRSLHRFVLGNRLARHWAGWIRYYAQLNRNDLVFVTTTNGIRRLWRSALPASIVEADSESLETLARISTGTVIVSVHYPIPATLVLLSRKLPDKNYIILAADPETHRRMHRALGIETCNPIGYVKSDKYCFAKLHKLVDANTIVLCTPDYRSENKLHSDVIRSGIFHFAKRTGLELLFSKLRVSQDGELTVRIRRFSNEPDPVDTARRFCDYLSPEKVFSVRELR